MIPKWYLDLLFINEDFGVLTSIYCKLNYINKHSFKWYIVGCGDFIGRFDDEVIIAIKELILLGYF